MSLEVLLSTVNLNKKDLDKMNITSNCTVINQSDKNDYIKYKNFNIYSYKEKGTALSRNRGLSHVSGDIILLCDDDVVYNKDYEKLVTHAFKNNKDADIITFNLNSPYRKVKPNKKNKRLHIYNSLRYSSSNIAFRKDSIINNNISFNTLFGSNAKYGSGEDTLFIVEALKKGLRVYSSTYNIGTIYHKKSIWFKGYNKRYFFDKGALFTAISYKYRHLLILQYLLRHKEVLSDIGFYSSYKEMVRGSNDYKERYLK